MVPIASRAVDKSVDYFSGNGSEREISLPNVLNCHGFVSDCRQFAASRLCSQHPDLWSNLLKMLKRLSKRLLCCQYLSSTSFESSDSDASMRRAVDGAQTVAFPA